MRRARSPGRPHDQGWELLTAQGRLGELAGALPEMFPDPESVQARGTRALVLLAAGARAEAAEVVAPLLDPGPGEPPDNQSLLAAAYATELVAAFGTGPAAEALYARCCRSPTRRWCPAWPSRSRARSPIISGCSPPRSAGAAAAGHLEQAVAAHERLGAVTWALRSRYELARIQLDEPARRDAALAALADVAREAGRLGMTQLARDAEAAGSPPGRRRPPAGCSPATARCGRSPTAA